MMDSVLASDIKENFSFPRKHSVIQTAKGVSTDVYGIQRLLVFGIIMILKVQQHINIFQNWGISQRSWWKIVIQKSRVANIVIIEIPYLFNSADE